MTKKYSVLTAALTILVLTSATAFAGPIADANYTSSGIDFSLKSGVSSAVTLTVSGPGDFYVQQDFKAGQAPYLNIFDNAGNNLVAGLYKWTLTENPTVNGDRATAAKASGQTQDGAFTIEADGSLANPNLIEGGFNKDQVFNDDVIVDGSLCAGMDCANGLNFGFDTVIIKENNTRLLFDDTSSGTGSFPSNDWRLTANDSANGGAEYFSIDDVTGGKVPFKIEAGAISNALYVDSDGDVGVGTSNPIVEVHAVDGNSPTFRLQQDGSNGFTPQIWDIAGNETNFFVRDVTNGSALPFRIEPGADDNAIYIDSTNKIGMGTNNPSAALDVRTTEAVGLALTRNSGTIRFTLTDTGNSSTWQIGNEASGQEFRVSKDGTGNTEFIVDASGNGTFDGTLEIGNTNTGSGAGTSACIDSAGKLCACGSCG